MPDTFTGLLTAIVFLPAIGAAIVGLLARGNRTARWIAAATMALDLGLAIGAWRAFSQGGRVPLVDQIGSYGANAWIPGLNAVFSLRLDGLSLPLAGLTGLLGLVAVLASWHITLRVREYFVWLLVLSTGVQGVFAAGDLLLFFLFWEVELIPMYFLIAIWGTGRKEYSATKFVLYTIFGSAFMLIGILVLRLSTGTFDMVGVAQALRQPGFQPMFLTLDAIFLFFLIAFAIKLPVWPLHTWLPDAHTDAPTAVSVMLAGVLLKMGGYGILRFNLGFFPEVADRWAEILAVLAVINILYGAAVVFRQSDLKRLIAYSSVSHMGIVLLGVASLGVVGVTGAAVQMFAHGTITGLLFLMVGMIYDRAHTRHIPDLGGLASKMPVITAVFVLAGLASLGLPLLSGFVAELTVFLGTFKAWPWATALGAFGIVLTAGYILWMLERVLFGPAKERFAGLKDAAPVDILAMALLVVPIIAVGVYPAPLVEIFTLGTTPLLGR